MSTGSFCGSGRTGGGTRLDKVKELCSVLEQMSSDQSCPLTGMSRACLEGILEVLQYRHALYAKAEGMEMEVSANLFHEVKMHFNAFVELITEVVGGDAEEDKIIARAEKFIAKWTGFNEDMEKVLEEVKSSGNPFWRPPSTVPPSTPPATPWSTSPTGADQPTEK